LASTVQSSTWDDLFTLSLRAKRKRITDNISDSYPTIDHFRSSKVVETENGGKQIQEDLQYKLDTSTWFSGFDTLPTESTQGVTAAFYNWKYLATPITISMTEEKESRKSDSAIKLLEAKTKRAMTTHFDTVNAALHTAQTGKAHLGLPDVVSASAGATVGGINSTSETWWDNKRQAFGGTNFLTASGNSTQGLVIMKDLWNDVSEGSGEHPSVVLTTHGIGGDYESLFEGSTYLRLSPKDGNGVDGRDTMFRKAKVIMDRDCGSGLMYFLNTKYLKYKIQSGLNFAKTPFREPANQLAKTSFVVLSAALTVNNRRRQGVITGLTSS
jgi:hypothetical protein